MRSFFDVSATLLDDRENRVYWYVWFPILCLQLAFYTRTVAKFWANPVYETLGEPKLYRNHLDNVVSFHNLPSILMLGLHLFMAWFWVFGVMLQKFMTARMSYGVYSFDLYRKWHKAIGYAMVFITLAGLGIGGYMSATYQSEGPMRNFLMFQSLLLSSLILSVPLTARWKGLSVRWHKMMAEIVFLGSAVVNFWTEPLIHYLQLTPLGPVQGEYVGAQVGGALSGLLVALPAVISAIRNRND